MMDRLYCPHGCDSVEIVHPFTHASICSECDAQMTALPARAVDVLTTKDQILPALAGVMVVILFLWALKEAIGGY